MNNPGMDTKIWEQLRKKWSDLDSAGHTVKVTFKLITDPEVENKTLAIDVIQNIDGEWTIETVQRNAGEAYEPLGIAGISMEHLVEAYKKTMSQLYYKTLNHYDADLIVTMAPTSSTSGEVRASLENKSLGTKSILPVNYRHYYMLTTLREKMVEMLGDEWDKVTAIYRPDALEFYFDY